MTKKFNREQIKIAKAIFKDIESDYHICGNEELCCRNCVEGEDEPCPCWEALKEKYGLIR